jgi:hypothetical protein
MVETVLLMTVPPGPTKIPEKLFSNAVFPVRVEVLSASIPLVTPQSIPSHDPLSYPTFPIITLPWKDSTPSQSLE